MRQIYLIRHGHPDFPIGSRICLGQTDTPLGPLGHLQGVLLAQVFHAVPLSAVYTSPLSRTRETAHYLTSHPIEHPFLKEQSTGLWDGLHFDEIKIRWPDAYNARSDNITLPIPGGENINDATLRFANAVNHILSESTGNIAIVAHASVIRGFIAVHMTKALMSSFAQVPKLPYGGYWHLTTEDSTIDTLQFANPTPLVPHPPMTRALALALLEAVAPQRVIRHALAVEDFALTLCNALPLQLDHAQISHAALLHDIARCEKNHAEIGALWLEKLGYADLGAIIRCHHDLNAPQHIDEAAIVYIADKAVQEDQYIGIDARFAAAQQKCCTPEALCAWQKRRDEALTLKQTINSLAGKEILL